MYKSKKAILATGGIDSTVLMYREVKNNPIILTIDYGQKVFGNQKKLLEYHCQQLNLNSPVIIKIEYKDWQTKPGLFSSKYAPQEEAPLENWNELRYKEFFIEGRNLIMVAYALAYCSAHNIDELLAGYLYNTNEWQNLRSYKLMTGDNSPQFVNVVNLIANMGFSSQVLFRAPFYESKQDKEDVIKEGILLGIDFSKTYSCYFDIPCNKCDNCLERNRIFKKYNINDK